jgi:hypothetical protein
MADDNEQPPVTPAVPSAESVPVADPAVPAEPAADLPPAAGPQATTAVDWTLPPKQVRQRWVNPNRRGRLAAAAVAGAIVFTGAGVAIGYGAFSDDHGSRHEVGWTSYGPARDALPKFPGSRGFPGLPPLPDSDGRWGGDGRGQGRPGGPRGQQDQPPAAPSAPVPSPSTTG